MLYVLTEPGRLFGNAVATESIDLILDGQVLSLLVLVSWASQRMRIIKQIKTSSTLLMLLCYYYQWICILWFSQLYFLNWEPVLTHFTEAFVFIDPAVDLDCSVSGVLQYEVGRVLGVCVFLDGLEQKGVTGDSLNRHHQEETQSGCIHIRTEDRWDQGSKMKGMLGNTLVYLSFGSQWVVWVLHNLRQLLFMNLRGWLDGSDHFCPQGLFLFVAVL